MSDYLLPDVKRDVRTWLRTMNLGGVVGRRVVFKFTEEQDMSWPAVRITQVGSSPLPGTTPEWTVDLAIDVYGRPRGERGTGTSDDVDKAARHLQALLFELDDTVLGDTYVGGVTVSSDVDSDDPDDGAPRRLLSTTWIVHTATAVAS